MSTALTLVVLIASADARDPSSIAMAQAARQALGEGTRVLVREAPPGIDDASALALSRTLGADAVVEVAWKDEGHRRALLRVRAASSSSPRWIDREIGFDAGDADQERGRTLGFAVASMIPDRGGAPSGSDARAGDDGEDEDAGTARARRWKKVAVEAVVIGSAGVQGSANGGGAALRAAWYLAPRFELHAGGGLRAGTLGSADATSLSVSAAVGAGFRPLVPSPRSPFGVGARVETLLLRDSVQRRSGGSASRWIPGGGLAIEVSWEAAPPLSLVGAAGAEIAFGTTQIVVAGHQVAEIPPLRLIAEAGIRIEF